MATTTANETQSRSVSTAATINGSKRRIDNLFQYPYENNRHPRLMAYDIHRDNLLIYSLTSHKLDCLSVEAKQINPIHLNSNESLLSLGYSSFHRCFYLITKQTHHFVLFHLNNQQIQIENQFELTHENHRINSLIGGQIHQNILFFLYNPSPGMNMCGKYNFDQSIFISPIHFENIVHDNTEKLSYEIIDFTVNNSYITFLTRLTNSERFMLVVHDHDLYQITSFDLLDAKQPLSIISTNQFDTSQIVNEETQLLLYINDPKSHIIHCCTHERYLISIDSNSFGICLTTDQNLILVGNKDIRGLNVQDYIQRN
jgi:hypothetical protein